ncbi:MAG: cell division protein ZipA [Pseudomonadota bacterium]|nr:cell division protein ZipA [Pseudomonadota bacterium]
MSLRELIILLLGLAIIGIILRGLFVALQARRGQLRMAIDKNIPADIDLDALELAELPSGGARVVRRDGAMQEGMPSKLERAALRAEALDLEEESEAVPVLMDSVVVGHSDEPAGISDEEKIAENTDSQSPETPVGSQHSAPDALRVSDEPVVPQQACESTDDAGKEMSQIVDRELALGDFLVESPLDEVNGELSEQEPDEAGRWAWDDSGGDPEAHGDVPPISGARPTAQQADPDPREDSGGQDAIMDYGAVDEDVEHPDEVLLDYEESDDALSESVFITADPAAQTDQGGSSEQPDDIDESDEADEIQEPEGYSDESGQETEVDDDLNEFSMTAGERIGGNPSAPAHTALFDEGDNHSAKRTTGAETLISRAAALLGSWRKRRSEKTAVAVSAPVDEQQDSFVFEDEEEAVIRQEVEDSDAATVESPTDGSGADTAEAQLASSRGKELVEGEEDYMFDGVDEAVGEEQTAAAGEQLDWAGSASVEAQQKAPGSRPSEVQQQAPVAQPAEVLVCNVMAREGSELHGDDLLEALITNGLKFGEMNIFHKRFRGTSNGPVIFSVANILNPGTFDLNAMAEFRTIGVSLFLALPSPINNLEAFEQMLNVAIHLKESLDGELKDDHRNVMTAQTIEHYRQRIRDFELRQLRAAGKSA